MSDRLVVRTVCRHDFTFHHVVPGRPEDCTESREIVLRKRFAEVFPEDGKGLYEERDVWVEVTK